MLDARIIKEKALEYGAAAVGIGFIAILHAVIAGMAVA